MYASAAMTRLCQQKSIYRNDIPSLSPSFLFFVYFCFFAQDKNDKSEISVALFVNCSKLKNEKILANQRIHQIRGVNKLVEKFARVVGTEGSDDKIVLDMLMKLIVHHSIYPSDWVCFCLCELIWIFVPTQPGHPPVGPAMFIFCSEIWLAFCLPCRDHLTQFDVFRSLFCVQYLTL